MQHGSSVPDFLAKEKVVFKWTPSEHRGEGGGQEGKEDGEGRGRGVGGAEERGGHKCESAVSEPGSHEAGSREGGGSEVRGEEEKGRASENGVCQRAGGEGGGRLRAFDWLAGGGAQGHARARLSTKRPYALGYGCMSRWMCEWVYGVAVSFSDTQIHRYTDTQSHKCAQMAEFSGEYGNTWVFGALVLRYPWIFGHHTHPPRGPWLAYPLRCRGY